MRAPRLPDWEARLAAYLESHRLRPFAWGDHDCCLFCAGAVESMTGVDPMPEFRGRYSTAIGAERALRRYGGGTLDATLDDKFTPVTASLARRGDIIMSGGLLGICLGLHLVAVGQEGEREGLIRIARSAWDQPLAWRVG
ncbi:DUF6950 family protein [Sphingomonas yabuuchiae]